MRKGQKITVFDIDNTIVDSTHRTPNNPDGTLNLAGYFKNRTRESIFKDTLLPLAETVKDRKSAGEWVVLCTARHVDCDDLDFLKAKGIVYDEILSRSNCKKKYINLPDPQYKSKQLNKYKDIEYEFYDDAKPIIELFSSYRNVNMIDANKANTEIAK